MKEKVYTVMPKTEGGKMVQRAVCGIERHWMVSVQATLCIPLSRKNIVIAMQIK